MRLSFGLVAALACAFLVGGATAPAEAAPAAISGPAPGAQTVPAIASSGFTGNNFLVVWADSRNGEDLDIYGARLSLTGALIDASSFAISSAPEDQRNPAVAFDGSRYYVVWEDNRDFGNDIYGARVETNGTSRSGGVPRLDGTRTGSVRRRSGRTVRSRSSPGRTGGTAARKPTPTSTAPGSRRPASMQPAAGAPISTADDWQLKSEGGVQRTNSFIVVWDDQRAAIGDLGQERQQPGRGSNAAEFKISGDDVARDAEVGGVGTGTLVVWSATDEDGDGDIRGATVSTTGAVLDARRHLDFDRGRAISGSRTSPSRTPPTRRGSSSSSGTTSGRATRSTSTDRASADRPVSSASAAGLPLARGGREPRRRRRPARDRLRKQQEHRRVDRRTNRRRVDRRAEFRSRFDLDSDDLSDIRSQAVNVDRATDRVVGSRLADPRARRDTSADRDRDEAEDEDDRPHGQVHVQVGEGRQVRVQARQGGVQALQVAR